MTTREAFEAYIKAHQSGDCWNLWQAATNAALERAIQACKNVAAKRRNNRLVRLIARLGRFSRMRI